MERFQLKQFAETGDKGIFGSWQAGNATTSNDPATLQSLPAWVKGWAEAISGGSQLPAMEEFQAVQYLICKAVKELYSEGIPFWLATETYYINSVVSYFDDNNVYALYQNLTGDNISTIPPEDTTNWKQLSLGGAGGASDKIGSIIALFASSTYTPDGCLPCDGTEYNKSDYSVFFTTYLAGGKLATCTYEEYESDITTYGQCAKFALDTTDNKFKVPTIKDGSYLTQALSDTEIGKAYNESLPNITGATKIGSTNYQVDSTTSGAFEYDTSSHFNIGAGSDVGLIPTKFNASRSSSTYQDNAKVQGDNVRVRFFVVVAVVPDDLSDDILNSKADKSQFQVVDALPETPDENVFYFIPESE